MLLFPGLHIGDVKQISGLVLAISRDVNNAGRRGKSLWIDGVCRAVRNVPAGNPGARRIKMGARMLPQFEPVPGEKRPVFVVFTDFVNLNIGLIMDWIVWKILNGRGRTQHSGAVNHLDLAG